MPGGGLNNSAQEGTTAINAEYASALRWYQLRLNEVANFERTHNITERWMPDHPEYTQSLEYAQHRTFIRCVEELEGLVVQHLSELAKANLAGTGKLVESSFLALICGLLGYKLRRHISKAITRRSATIRAALERYNKLAPRQRPPWPKLDYTDVIRYSTLGEFELLKYSRYSILEKPWTTPLNREMSMKFFRLLRSREEIERLNVEILQLQAWVDFDDENLRSVASTFKADNEDMAAELYEWYLHRHRVNNIHRSRLSKIYGLTGYTGIIPICADNQLDSDHEEEAEEEDSDEVARLSETLERMQ